MDKALYAFFKLNKCAEVSKTYYLYRDFSILRILLRRVLPGVIKLLVTQADAAALCVYLKN